MNSRSLAALLALGLGLVAGPVLAATPAAPALLAHQTPLVLNEAASAWILTSTALVLLMTLPGLALFYGGMVRRKNVLSTIAHSTAAMVIVTVLWFIVGYSLSFGPSGAATNGFIGGLQAAFLNGVTPTTAHSLAPGLPEFLWIAYQLTFAIISPARTGTGQTWIRNHFQPQSGKRARRQLEGEGGGVVGKSTADEHRAVCLSSKRGSGPRQKRRG